MHLVGVCLGKKSKKDLVAMEMEPLVYMYERAEHDVETRKRRDSENRAGNCTLYY